MPLDASQEILIFHKGYAPELRVIGPSDYKPVAGGQGASNRAEIDVTLTPLPK